MRKLKSLLRRIRLVYRPGSRRTKQVLLCVIGLSLIAILALNLTIHAIQANTEEARQQAAALEQENDKLKDNIAGLGSAESAEQIARDELGLVDPNTTVVVPEH